MTNKERMLNGLIYDPSDVELQKIAIRCHDLCHRYNNLLPSDKENRNKILREIFPHAKENVYVQGNLYVDYGEFVEIGDNFYANYGLTILDTCPIKIGNNVYFGPNIGLYTPLHPLRYQERNSYIDKEKGYRTDDEYGAPIVIGDNCWFGGNVIVLPGVKIGSGTVIGAGSVVTHDIEENVLAAGNPCRVIRKITEKDSLKDYLK